ncbi:adenylate/guanylate cyclase domain-containing protein (plasmid) [Roseibium aggregatum]|uniref:adenylate/guanylate cyclase domain-containing protein n=1 Tax=Roseibium aggregatum TaxID=187304 RepID=UPI001E33F9FF|nr:adenylate/guanylate cyclase domain-containing protein [Roseibium aggregatum]UES60015.1 adenylate/guanylate cyclase domain-containing protein [Roseibium aggregatum]UES60139.1 adenylate/guanylate cyclase domain-containing protein [Roseibium aggregatum]
MDRRLSAIMAGDVVGYTRLMAERESAVHNQMRSALSEIIAPTVESYRGRMFKTTGDGFLAAFPSVNDALDAAIAIQKGFADQPLELRLGVNLGDVIEENDDVFGDGVNVASRLESMAHPGSIFVSEAVVKSADRSRASQFRALGKRHFKGLAEPLVVYSVRPEDEAGSGSFALQRILGGRRSLPFALAAILMLLAVSFAQVPVLRATAGQAMSGLTQLMKGQSHNARPTIAVLPFDNLSGDSGQDYFAEGLTEDIISNLAINPDLQVIARNSTFALRGKAQDVRAIATRLGANYVVEGSARQSGDQLRVVAQLIDAKSGSHLWSRTYDRRMEDIFAVQSELTSEIVAHMVSFVRDTEVQEAAARPPENLRAYDMLLRARASFKHGPKDTETLRTSRILLQRALEIDPGYAAARAELAMTYFIDVAHSISGSTGEAGLDIGLSEARQAVRLEPNLGSGYQALSFGLAIAGEFGLAIQAATRAVELNPNDPDSLMTLAKAQVRFSAYEEAVRNAERARQLHPLAPDYYMYVHGQALYAAGRLDEADTVLQECLMRAPNEVDCLLIRAAAQIARGSMDAARSTMTRLTEVSPDFSLAAERAYRRFGESPLMRQFLVQLVSAGAPEATG